jgi:Ran GTPase-activating protein (RanGAP) involved in mRNA processing and transport
MVVNIMSKEQEQNENIKIFTDYVDKISSGENKEATIFDLASAYAGINFDITYYLNDDEKAYLQKSLAEKYNLDNQKLLSEITYSIIEKAIDKAIANKYNVTIFDIDKAISLLPENLVMKVIAATNSEYLKIENYLSLENVSKETITEIYQNIILTNKCTTEILKSLIDKGFSVPEDSIVNLMNKKMDDVVSGKIKYLLSLNIEYSKDFAKDLIDDIENNIFKDKENIIANYAKYEDVLLKIKYKLNINLLTSFKTQISKREEVQNFAQDVLTKKIDEFNGYNKEEEKDANYIKIILDLHHLDIIANSSKDNTLTSQFISKIEDYDVTKYNNLVNGIKKNKTIIALDLARNNIGDDGAKALADALKVNKTITTLNLAWNKIGIEGAKALAEALEKNKTITTFNLWGNNIGDDGAIALADALKVNETITELCLFRNNIKDDGAKALAGMLEKNKTITKLDLSRNNIGDDGAIAIAGMLEKNETITELDLSGNNIGVEGVIELGRACAGKDITVDFGDTQKNDLFKLAQGTFTGTTFNLWGNEIGGAGAKALADMLKVNKTITKLDLSGNKIGDDGVIAIAEALKENNTITTLHLLYNKIECAGAKALASMLQMNNTITVLYLSGNNIGIEGAIAISKALKVNKAITKLYLGGNAITDNVIIALGRACVGKEIKVDFGNDKNNYLFKLAQGTFEGEKLYLQYNYIGDAGAKALAEALKVNNTITTLNLSYNNIGIEGAKALGRACAGKDITVEFGDDEKNDLFKLAQKYGNKKVESSYFFNIPAAATGIFTASTIITLATIITLSILASQGIIGFDSAAFIAPIASVGAINLVTFIGFAITEVTSKIMDYKNVSEYNQFHKNDKGFKPQKVHWLNPCHKVQFVDKVLSEQNNNEKLL